MAAQLLLWPVVPADLAARLAAVGCSLHHDPKTTNGYTAQWRLDGASGGPSWFGSLDGVEAWLSRVETDEKKKRRKAA